MYPGPGDARAGRRAATTPASGVWSGAIPGIAAPARFRWAAPRYWRTAGFLSPASAGDRYDSNEGWGWRSLSLLVHGCAREFYDFCVMVNIFGDIVCELLRRVGDHQIGRASCRERVCQYV